MSTLGTSGPTSCLLLQIALQNAILPTSATFVLDASATGATAYVLKLTTGPNPIGRPATVPTFVAGP